MSPEHSKIETPRTIKGRCMCGDIRYEITGPIYDMVHCHCESCRRQSSTAFATFFNVDKKHFRYTSGTPVPYTSSPGVERTHCGRCGSPISYENAREFSLFACTLEDLTLVVPEAHIMVTEMMPWLEFGDDLPNYQTGLHGKQLIGHGPSSRPRVGVEKVRTNSKETNATRDNSAAKQHRRPM